MTETAHLLTITSVLAAAASRWGERPAILSDSGQTLSTWAELDTRAWKIAAGLTAAGIGRGDAVAVAEPQTPETLALIHGILRSGAAVALLNLQYTDRENVAYLGLVERDFSLAFAASDPASARFPQELSHHRHLTTSLTGGDAGWLLLDQPEAAGSATAVPIAPTDPAWIIATSGSTGTPKPTIVSHRAAVHAGESSVSALGLTEHDRILGMMPLFHAGGLTHSTMMTTLSGASLVPLPVFDPASAARIVPACSVTVMAAFDTLFQKIGALPDFEPAIMRSLRAVTLAGSRKYFDVLQGWGVSTISQFYGMTEGVIVSFVSPEITDDDVRKWSNGLVAPGVEVRIVDPDTGESLPDGQGGEICFKGPNLCLGYAGLPELAAQSVDADGFFHSGDRGHLRGGALYFQGRYKNVVKSGGENVSELEVEDFLGATIPEIRTVAVVGAPDEVFTEAVCAFVEWQPGAELTLQELRELCRGQLAGFKIPRRLFPVRPGAWPLLASGKLDKAGLRATAAGVGRSSP
jgi:fatty-acyl-CoA synthase